MTNTERIQANNAELREAIEMAESLPDAETNIEIVLQNKTITPSETTQEVTADANYTALEKVTVEPIPSKYIVPSGTKDITSNGNHSVTEYDSVSVSVPIPDGYIKPSGTKDITENGEHDVKSYEKVKVAIFGDGDCNAVEHSTAYELDDLILWYGIVWYDSITSAVEDVKNVNIGANALADSAGATVGVYEDNGIPCIVLLKDCTISSPITLANFCINLNGCVLTSTASVAIEVSGNSTIDGRAKGSKIIASRTAVNVVGGDCTIISGVYETTPSGTGVSSSPDGVLVVADGAQFNLSHASVISTDYNGGTICGIWAKGNSVINAYDCNFEIVSKSGLNVCGMYGDGSGEATFTNCNIVADADHTANAAGTDYGTMSRAIYYTGTLYLYNCYVYGTHSGVTAKGDITVIGGTYDGYSHGGFYISSGVNGVKKTAYIYDATVKECALHEGYIDDGVAGTNHAGMYIGGASNTTIYIDNCNLCAEAQVIVLRGTSAEQNNTLYISGTHINHTYSRAGIRIDSNTHKVYIGAHCNFTTDDTDRASVCTETDEVYRLSVEEETINLQEKTIVENGEYTADDGYDGLGKVYVNVPSKTLNIQPLEITENGTYTAPDGVDGYSPVTVNVPSSGGGSTENLLDLHLTNTLTSIDSQITSVAANACYGASKITTVNLPNATSIGSSAFRGCSGITQFNAPKVTSLGTYAFYGCSGLTEVNFQGISQAPSTCFYQCTSLKKADFGVKCKTLAGSSLAYCSKLDHLILRYPDGVVSIATNTFSGANFNGYVYCPAALIEDYKVATNWVNYASNCTFRAIEDYPDICGG